ncbi:hypothetical protein ACFX14_011457 [Malus domestica]
MIVAYEEASPSFPFNPTSSPVSSPTPVLSRQSVEDCYRPKVGEHVHTSHLHHRMATMSANMCTHHGSQLKIVTDLKSLDIAHTPMETPSTTMTALSSFGMFSKNGILTLVQRPPIQALLHSWHDSLEKLPDELAKSAISSFAAVIKTIILHQEKRECEAHQSHCIQVREEKSLGSFKTRLPETFRAMTDYANACSIASSASINGEAAEKKNAVKELAWKKCWIMWPSGHIL